MRRGEWCRHFTGIQNKTCKLGIAYDAVRDAVARPYQWPCTFGLGHCDKRAPYTQEELAAQDAEFNARLGRTGKARAAIMVSGLENGEIACPCCAGGKLRFSVARLNGHVHAACSTEGCVRWME